MNGSADPKPARKIHSQIETKFDSDLSAYWAFMEPSPRPCFNHAILDELSEFIGTIRDSHATVGAARGTTISYGVLASNTRGVFNLGGDLALFKSLIDLQDRNSLLDYGKRCIDNLLAWHHNCNVSMTSIALVQGDALGGGFEAALSATVLVAEESSRFGFPEILFNLFPGMGAFSFLSRKIGRRASEEMITSGTIYTARELYDRGVIDVLTPDGTGEAAVNGYIKKHSRNRSGRQAFEKAKNVVSEVTQTELVRVVEIWADTAMRLQERDLKVMDRLIKAQARNTHSISEAAGSNIVPLRAIGGNV
jgi:DSF synthase